MNILVIENERTCADRLIGMLNDCYHDVNIFGPLASIAEIRCFFQEEVTIDIILSDIKLDDGLSFDALVDIPNNTPVIFITTHDEYAIKAFNYNGIAYLLKPIKRDELTMSIDKYNIQKKAHFITDGLSFPIDYGEGMKNIYALEGTASSSETF